MIKITSRMYGRGKVKANYDRQTDRKSDLWGHELSLCPKSSDVPV